MERNTRAVLGTHQLRSAGIVALLGAWSVLSLLVIPVRPALADDAPPQAQMQGGDPAMPPDNAAPPADTPPTDNPPVANPPAHPTPRMTPPRGSGRLDFTLRNRTGTQINYVYVSRHSSSNWNGDTLGSDVIPSGSDYHISPTDIGEDNYDIKIILESGRNHTFMNIDLAQNHALTLYYLNNQARLSSGLIDKPEEAPSGTHTTPTPAPNAPLGPVDFRLHNHTGQTIMYVYVSRPGSNSSTDLLGDDVIENSATYTIRPRGIGENVVNCDIRIVMSGNRTHIFHNVALSQISDITIYYTASGRARLHTDIGGPDLTEGGVVGMAHGITLTNRAHADVYYVYVARHGITAWGADLLGSEVVSSGANFTLQPAVQSGRRYDVKIVMDGDHSQVFSNLDLSRITSMTLSDAAGGRLRLQTRSRGRSTRSGMHSRMRRSS